MTHELSRRAAIRSISTALAVAPAAALAQRGAGLPQLASAPTADQMVATLSNGIFINANEFPLGPGPAARKALAQIPTWGGRYGFPFAGRVEALFAEQNGLKPENVTFHPGSFVPLRNAALAYASAERPLAYGIPTFNQGFLGRDNKPIVKTVMVPADGQHRIDVRALLAAAPNAGLYCLCNPNNPTGLATTRADIEWLLAHKPKDAKVLIDEAYIHFSNATSAIDLVAAGADVLVTRTFSKIYGLAGLRAGLVIGRKDLLDGMLDYGVNVAPLAAVLAAEASLLDQGLVEERIAFNAKVREDLFAFFRSHGFEYLPSETNFAMVKTARPGKDVVRALAAQKIYITSYALMPDWVRVSMGTPAEMAVFKPAFLKALAG